METNKKIEWVLQIAVAGEFVGHGVFAFLSKVVFFNWWDMLKLIQKFLK